MRTIPLMLALAVAVPSAPLLAQDAPQRDPRALQALERMGAALRALPAFTVVADVVDEDVLTDGQKLQYIGKVTLRSAGQKRFRIDAESDRKVRTIYYDGSRATLFAPRRGLYTTLPAPATADELIRKLENDHGVQVPLADLFALGTDKAALSRITSALPVGSDTIDGVRCLHFAMRQPGADWQVWLREGDQPLPCKYVITTTDDPSMPQYSVVLRWDTSTPVPPDTFVFTPPAGAHPIALAKADTAMRSAQ